MGRQTPRPSSDAPITRALLGERSLHGAACARAVAAPERDARMEQMQLAEEHGFAAHAHEIPGAVEDRLGVVPAPTYMRSPSSTISMPALARPRWISA
jgi:hypothetical protein